MSSELRVDKIVPTDGVPTGGGGGIIQIKSTTKTDHFSMASLTPAEITGFNVSITPKFNTSKILLLINASFGGDQNAYLSFTLKRDSQLIALTTVFDGTDNRTQSTFGGHSGSNNRTFSGAMNFLDSPATTSTVTYKMFLASLYSNLTVHVNRSHTDSNNTYNQGMVSTITAMEVSA